VATFFDVMEVPRSACTTPGAVPPPAAMASVMNPCASSAVSVGAIIACTTLRE
jgi:hypothetical protein